MPLSPTGFSNSAAPKGRALIFAAHPDDEVYGCGGAIVRHIRNGDPLKVVIVTDGACPVNDVQNRLDYAQIRRNESIRAAERLGYREPDFLDYPDMGLKSGEQLIAHLLDMIHAFQPENIYLPSETEIHPDHRALCEAGLAAIRRYPNAVDLFFYEIGQTLTPNFLHDITDLQPLLDEAMDCFESQLAVQDYKTHIRSLHAYRSYTLGKEAKYTEAYRVLGSNELKPDEEIVEDKNNFEHEQVPEPTTAESAPLISIIVRTMNRSELSEALDSIAGQTYPNLEVVVVDARGEAPLKLGARCGRHPLRVISGKKPLNRPQAANAGLRAVKGVYFSFLDEDDLLFPDALTTLHQQLSRSRAPAAYCVIERVSQESEHEWLYNGEYNYAHLYRANYIPIHALLFTSDVIKQGCSFDENLEVYEDWDFLLQVADMGKFLFSETKGGLYRNLQASGIHRDKGCNDATRCQDRVTAKWIPKLVVEQSDALEALRHGQDALRKQIKQVVLETNSEMNALHKKQREMGRALEERRAEIAGLRAHAEQLADALAAVRNAPAHKLFTRMRTVKDRITLNVNKRWISRSELFDVNYYLRNNMDVQKMGMNPLEHYILYGGYEGRNPSPHFDATSYLEHNPDVAASGVNPLVHYLRYGKKEGRTVGMKKGCDS